MDLRQVEADVVIALSCDKGDFVRGRIIPIWECEDNLFVLTDFAEQKALEFVEEIGHETVSYKIYDFRTKG